MNYGPAEGGPFHGRNIVHPEPRYRVAIDKRTQKAVPGVIGGADYDMGEYRWNGKVWTWTPPANSSSSR